MLLFWMICILMMAIAALAFVIPLLGKRQLTGATRDQLNKDLYQNRINELQQDEDQGLMEQSADFIDEMQRGLLDDVVDEKATISQLNTPLLWLGGLVFLVIFSVSVYFTLGAQQKVADWQAVYAKLPELTNRVMNDGDKVTEADISEFRLALTTKMMNEPDNEFGWLLLGRLNVALGDSEAAFIAMDRAYQRAPTNSAIVTGYAQALMLSGEPDKVMLSKQILAGLMQEKPDDIEVISTSAFMALENLDYLGAIEQWQRMIPLLAGQPERIEMIQGSINYAKKQIALQTGSLPEDATISGSDTVSSETVNSESNVAVTTAQADKSEVTITVKAAGAGQQQGYLFVYVQASEGPKAPLAVKRILNPTFPLTLTLSDRDAMMSEMKISLFPAIKVSAKLSQDATVTTADDDIRSNEVIVSESDARNVTLELPR
jgi:cytochrome c-type biogenesis protein CcmI